MRSWVTSRANDPSHMTDGDYKRFARYRPLRRDLQTRLSNAETTLDASLFVYPMFLVSGSNIRQPIDAMPGIARMSADQAVREAETAIAKGVSRFLLFGLPSEKHPNGRNAWAPDEAVQSTITAIKLEFPEAVVITDVCLCEYTDHGHCGILSTDGGEVTVDNDGTLPMLARVAVSHAVAGSDIVAPSAMMDGQVAAIRNALDRDSFGNTKILGYSAKYASAFYGPFREAADSAPARGDRRTYQMQSAQLCEALREIEADISEGADAVMVKPALSYLDVIRAAKAAFPRSELYAYNVSGEYSMIAAAASNGWIDRRAAALEVLLSIRRAGSDRIITYFALEAADWLHETGGGIL